MKGKAPGKKSAKLNSENSSKGGIKKQQRIKTRLKIEQVNKESFLISELNQRDDKKTAKSSSETLKVKSLLKDHQKDKDTREASEQKKKDTDDHMLRQLEQISGFSL
ncbi:LAFA_0G00364g1_1 [Lachancea sp. 'fantastica']|nr:LAFA_0G00364g1_1 [Lachancea sp. 'fantastica']